MRLRSCGFGVLLGVLLGSCEGRLGGVSKLPEPAVPGAGSGMGTAGGMTAETPQCSVTGQLVIPRRLLRLSNVEVGASMRALFQVDDAALPAAWLKPLTPEAPNTMSTVSRDFLEQVSAVGSAAVETMTLPAGCSAESYGTDASCSKKMVSEMAKRAFRGHEDPADIDALVALALEVGGRSGPSEARRMVRRALVMSPKFLYLFEGVVSDGNAAPSRMRGLELASFLSFRLVGGPPPIGLGPALEAQPNLDAIKLATLVDQYFGPQIVADTAQGFLSGWANVSAIGKLSKDLSKNPLATPAFLSQLQTETWNALGALAAKNATFTDLLTENGRSDTLKDSNSDAYAAVGRPGIFSLPGVVAAMSGSAETNIPRRGRALLKKLFCESLSSPPAGAVAQAPPLAERATQRERFLRVEERQSCAGCHLQIDGLAFPFEVFDEMGQTRQVDGFQNVLQLDGVHSPVVGPKLSFKDVRDLMVQASAQAPVQSCFESQLFAHLARQEVDVSTNSCTGEALVQRVRRADGTLPLRESTLEALLLSSLAPRGD
jgi:Protein of unknown function (DUF1588)/Protein of unknown function (DUF1592)